MTYQTRLKVALRRVGNLLAIAGILFVTLRLYEYSEDIDLSRITLYGWFIILLMTLIYGSANLLLAFSWRNLLSLFKTQVTRVWAVRVYGVTQIAKYVPGNIFHLAGRQTMGMSDGIAAVPLLKSSIWELVLISATATLFILLTLPALTSLFTIPTSVTLFLFLSFIIYFFIWKRQRSIAYAFTGYLFFLLIAGLLFSVTLNIVTDVPFSWSVITGSYVLAWLIGLITPGAPAGVGIRELVLLFILKHAVVEADLVIAVLIGRLITICGDCLFFIGSIAANKIQP